MAISFKHAFTSAKADGVDTTLVQPSNWNAEHTVTMATARLLGRTTASTGAVEEISAGTGLSLASLSLSLATNGVANTNLAQMAANTLKGNNTGSTANAADLTVSQVSTLMRSTAANYWAATAGTLLDPQNVWTAADYTTLTDAATIAWDMSTGVNFVVTLAGNRTFGAPTNTKNGQSGYLRIVQDATGSRTGAWNSVFKFAGGSASAPVLTTTASAEDVFVYTVLSSTRIAIATFGQAVA